MPQTLHNTLKIVKMINFMLCVFYQKKNMPQIAYSNYKAVKLEINKNALNMKYTVPEKMINPILNNFLDQQ